LAGGRVSGGIHLDLAAMLSLNCSGPGFPNQQRWSSRRGRQPGKNGIGASPSGALILMAKPFGRLVRFELQESCHHPRVLSLLYRAILLYDMIVALVQDHDLHLVEWADASKVALEGQ
jgi:hypothetical protein